MQSDIYMGKIRLVVVLLIQGLYLTACYDGCNTFLEPDANSHVADPHYSINMPTVKMYDDGKAFVAWDMKHDKERCDNSTVAKNEVTVNSYLPERGWGKQYTLAKYRREASLGDFVNSLPRLAVNDTGTAIAIWGASDSYYGAAFTPGVGWSAVESIYTRSEPGTYEYHRALSNIAINDSGNAIAVVYDGVAGVYAIPHRQGRGWSTDIKSLIADVSGISDLSIVMNNSDQALVAWVDLKDSANHKLVAAAYDPASGWGGNEVIAESVSRDYAINLDSTGNIIVVWGKTGTVWAKSYRPTVGWEPAVKIHETSSASAQYAVAMNAGGNAVCVSLDSSEVWINHYTADTGWSGALVLQSVDGTPSIPKAAVDYAGNIVVAWRQISKSSSPNTYRDDNLIVARRYVVESGWDAAAQIMRTEKEIRELSLAMDNHGNAAVIWDQNSTSCDDDGCYYDAQLWASNFKSGMGWSYEARIGVSKL